MRNEPCDQSHFTTESFSNQTSQSEMVAVNEVNVKSDIQKLNDQVNAIVVEELKKNQSDISVDLHAVSHDKRVVYKDRHVWIPLVLMIACASANLFVILNGGFHFVLITSVSFLVNISELFTDKLDRFSCIYGTTFSLVYYTSCWTIPISSTCHLSMILAWNSNGITEFQLT